MAAPNRWWLGAAPFDHVDASIVVGVNDHELSRDKKILSSVKRTAQALVPLLYHIAYAYGIESAMTEIHAVTADQTINLTKCTVDLRRAHSGHNIPTIK